MAAIAAWGLAQACGFPDHTFIDDDEFHGTQSTGGTNADSSAGTGGDVSTGGATSKADASTGKSDGSVATDAMFDAGRQPDAGDGGIEAGDGAVETGVSCDPDLDRCDGLCVDFLTDDDHCGSCTTVCTAPEVCTSGLCQPPCPPGLTNCGGTCVDLDTDENHCGGCNRPACAPGDVCENGGCVVDCGSLTRCGPRLCVDTSSDDTHCGDCSTNCRTTGQVCVGGTCRANCVFPFTSCGQTCVNTQNDDDNCNTCGNACDDGEDCVNGACIDLVENCQNGTDDDEDLLIDCADPDCGAGYRCAGTPAGWNGPVAVWTGAPGAAPSCSQSGGYPTQFLSANANLSVATGGCGTCNCTPSAGMTCAPFAFEFDISTDCAHEDPWQDQIFVPTSSCTRFGLCCTPPTARSALLVGSPSSYVESGSCMPSQAPPSFPSPSWASEVRACGAPATAAGGCETGQCVQKPTAPYGTALCVYRSGVAACPSEYPVQRPGPGTSYYQTYADTRSCTACTCNSSCGGTITTYTDSSCGQGATVLDISTANACTTVPGKTQGGGEDRWYRFTNAGPVCGANPSTVLGSVTPQNPITVCCQAP